jgi:hypothetical protein
VVDLHEVLTESSADVRFFFSPVLGHALKQLARSKRTKFFDAMGLRKALEKSGTVFPPFPRESTAGVLLEIGPETLPSLRVRRRPFWYFVLNGIGSACRDNGRVALFCEPISRLPQRQLEFVGSGRRPRVLEAGELDWVVWGYSEILDVQSIQRDNVTKHIAPSERLWTDSDLHFHYSSFFVNQDPHGALVALRLSEPTVVGVPLSAADFADDGMLKYMMADGEITTCYLNENTINVFKGRVARAKPAPGPDGVEDAVWQLTSTWAPLLPDGDQMLLRQSLEERRRQDSPASANLDFLVGALISAYSVRLRPPYDDLDRVSLAAHHALRMLNLLSTDNLPGVDTAKIDDWRKKLREVVARGAKDG